MAGAVENITNNENVVEDKTNVEEKNEEKEENIIINFFKNPKTGDYIIAYVVIFILALLALIIAKKKSNK